MNEIIHQNCIHRTANHKQATMKMLLILEKNIILIILKLQNAWTNEQNQKLWLIHILQYILQHKKDIGFASPIAEDFRLLYEWIDTRFANIEEMIQNSLHLKNKKKRWSKPSFLPFTSEEEVLQFDNAEETTYDEVVCYLQYIGGFSLKEALNLCFKEIVKDEVMSSFTFYGNKEEGINSFFKTKLCSAIQEAISENKYFQAPSATEFRHDMIEAIRNTKQRKRNTIKKSETNSKRYIHEEEMQKIFIQRQQKHLRRE